jgi:hypothetical protein
MYPYKAAFRGEEKTRKGQNSPSPPLRLSDDLLLISLLHRERGYINTNSLRFPLVSSGKKKEKPRITVSTLLRIAGMGNTLLYPRRTTAWKI